MAGIDPDPRETLRAIREQLQIEQVGSFHFDTFRIEKRNSEDSDNGILIKAIRMWKMKLSGNGKETLGI